MSRHIPFIVIFLFVIGHLSLKIYPFVHSDGTTVGVNKAIYVLDNTIVSKILYTYNDQAKETFSPKNYIIGQEVKLKCSSKKGECWDASFIAAVHKNLGTGHFAMYFMALFLLALFNYSFVPKKITEEWLLYFFIGKKTPRKK